MKRISFIFIFTFAFVVSIEVFLNSKVLKGLFPQFPYPNMLQTLVQDLVLVLIMILLNHFIWKQKVLRDGYPLLKGFVLLWPAWIFLIASIALIVMNKVGLLQTIFAFITVLAIGWLEEYIFRGLVLGTLVSKGKSIASAVVISSILFGLVHGANFYRQSLSNTLIQIVYSAAIGVFFAALYLKSNNILYPIIFHASFDLPNILGNSGFGGSSAGWGQALIVCVVVVVITTPYLLTGKKQIARFQSNLADESVKL